MLLCVWPTTIQSQQMYRIHLDNVKPSMVAEYEQISKEFIEACEEHSPAVKWITSVTNDFKYMYVSPLNSFSELDERPFKAMAEEMGDKFTDMFTRFDKCYDSHTDYVISLSKSLTYMPEGFSQTQEGMDNREYYFLYYTPSNQKKLYDALKAVKEMYTSKDSKEYYRIYNSGFGNPESYYLVAISSKDDVDAAIKSKENNEVLGDMRHEVFGNMMKYVSRFESYDGKIRRDLSYSPK
ncbi:hypothetical protein GSB9_00671 [Flavobacteriaceae bacterium GSB9]|nr:hypothetical protein GSB9_00671 [Flavobacteriaceae bacterium GSB9]